MSKKNKELSYQQAMQELESIVARVEEDELDVDELSAQVKRAMELVSYCRTRLRTTENIIQQAFEEEDQEEELEE
ncbi:MAG: exodeoxyribonuclease VII small subunit [Cyclobacteriaceae bacterium]